MLASEQIGLDFLRFVPYDGDALSNKTDKISLNTFLKGHKFLS